MADTVKLPPLTMMAHLRYDLVDRLLDDIGPISSILEIGCGQGAVGVRLAHRAPYLGVEPDDASYAVAAQRAAGLAGRARVLHGDSSLIDRDEQFDLVCAFEVLEHIEDDVAALKEWSAYVRPGGYLMLSVPAWQERFSAMDTMVGHFRRYDPDRMFSVLTEAGFTAPHVELYGYPLGFALEAARNRVAARKVKQAPDSIAERTSGSGRLFQPKGTASGTFTKVATAPFRLVQRSFSSKGTGLVALARRPA
ncbi:MAG: methyltransferase domain-containing protein [Mycobacteriales bacterium]